MTSKAVHRCLHVLDLEKSLAFYKEALGLTEIRRMGARRRLVDKRIHRRRGCGFSDRTHMEPRTYRALRQRWT